jgi:uncharacterized membrane protein
MPQLELDTMELTTELPQSSTGTMPEPWPVRARQILLWLMAIGAALRILRYLSNRSLWLDEAYLSNSILTYSFKQLVTQPLMHWQAAPVGFLLLQKLAVTLFGNSEYALRLVPLLAGLASIPLFYGIVRRCLVPTAQVLALGLFIMLDPLVYYSAEAKQYGPDVTIALAIVWAAMRWAESRTLPRLACLAVIGACAIFCSHPAIFVLASVGVVLFFAAARNRAGAYRPVRAGGTSYSYPQSDRADTARLGLVVVGIAWAGLFALNYFVFLRPLMHHSGLAAYWAADYMPHDVMGAVKWLGLESYELFHGYATMWLPLVDTAIVAALIGIIWFWRHDRSRLALLGLPILLTLGAAAVHAYPFGSRLVLFLVPGLIVMIGAGGALIWDSFVPGRRFIPALILASILAPTAARAAFYLVVPAKREEMKPVLAYIHDHKQPGDSLYIFYISEVPFRYCENCFGLEKDRYGLADMPVIFGQSGERDPSIYRSDLARLRGKGRVWVLITHPRALGGIDEEQLFPEILDQWGRQLDRVDAFNADAMLYDMGK